MIDQQHRGRTNDGPQKRVRDAILSAWDRNVANVASFDSTVRMVSAFAAAVFLIRVLGEPWDQKFRSEFPDSFSYAAVARRGPWRPSFWFDERPVGYPLLLWVTGRGTRLTAVIQASAYAAAWLVLVRVVIRRLGRPLAVLTALALGSVAFQGRFAHWTTALLSESLSMTLSVAMVAACWTVAATRTRQGLPAAVLTTVGWILVRDSNAMVAIVACIAVLGIGAVGWRRDRPALRRLAVLSSVGVLAAAFSLVGASVSTRARYAVPNNVGLRILPDTALSAWFVDQGMPMSDALAARAGKDAFADGEALLKSPELAAFQQWNRTSGGATIAKSLIIRFGDWSRILRRELPAMLADDPGYDRYGVSKRLPHGFDLLTPRTPAGLVAAIAISTGLGLVALAVQRRRAVTVFALVFLASSIADFLVSQVGDGLEIYRHVVGANLRVAVAVLVLFAVAVDGLARRLRDLAKGTSATEASP